MSARLLFPRLLSLGLASAAAAFGQYVYDYTGPVTSSSVTQNGAVDSWSPVAQFNTGGSLIWTPTVTGVSSNDYEVNTTVALAPGGGTYVEYLRATSNALLYPGGCTGTFYAVALTVPGTYTYGGAAGAMNFYGCTAGSLWWFGSASPAVLNGSTLRTVVFGTWLWVFIDDQFAAGEVLPGAFTGQPGIGGYGMTPSSGFSRLSIGHHDVVAPFPVSATGIRSSVLPNQVSLSWQAPQDDAIGIGVFGYNIFRNGVYLWGIYPTATFTDSTVTPGTTYTYTLEAVDFHDNSSAPTSFTVTTPPATSVDPRRTGVFTTGAYWGGGGEQIDMLSGNLNFSLPLVSPQGRPGWTVPVGLSYNSQNWRQDSATDWELGTDVGYGYGWSLQIGSITPYYTAWPWGVDHYVYTDGTGAQYRLDQNSGNVWSSLQGIYVWFDANTDTLHFKNGMFWLMGCVSSGAEQDAGTMYPTVIEDTAGNQVIVSYNGGAGLPSGSYNTSGRIGNIEDARNGGYASYVFTYSAIGGVTHLTAIGNYIGTTESYTSTYTTGVPLAPPFGSGYGYGTMTELSSIAVQVTGSYTSYNAYSMTYAPALAGSAGELAQVTFPWGGCLGWSYSTASYAGNRLLREVGDRYMNSSSSAPGCEAGYGLPAYPITHSDTGVSGGIPIVHADTTLADMSGNGAKKWTFNNSSGTAWEQGLVSEFDQMASATGTVITKDTYTWSQTVPVSGSGPVAFANPYISTKVSVKDPGTGSAASAQTNQASDQYGNTTQVIVYPYNSTSTPVATYTSTYVTTSGYLINYLLGLVQSSTITPGGGSLITLAANTHDHYPGMSCSGVASGAPTFLLDTALVGSLAYSYGGYLTSSITPAGTSTTCYFYGVPYSSTGVDGTTTSITLGSGTNYTVPDTITTPTYSNALTYNSWLGLTSTTGANGETLSLTYDSLGRPATGTSPYGAVTTYSYSGAGVLPVWQQTTGPNGFSQTTLDGFGRAILTQSGPSSTSIQSQTSTVYAPCACSPLGKIYEVSQPYAPGATEYWTTYGYDGIGRTLTTTLPDASSTTYYSYAGNVTAVTDPATNYKKFTTDVLGNLTLVTEPNPAGGTLTTSYTYDWMNHLTGSSMARGTTTQVRTFAYNSAGQLTSAANPESGTVTYTYNTDTTLNTKTDAKGQLTVYTYDGSKRVTETQIYPTGLPYEDICQRVTYTYGASAPENGQLISVQYGVQNPGSWIPLSGGCPGTAAPYSYQESYTHVAAGAVASKTFTLTTNESPVSSVNASIGVSYTYDTAGRLLTSTYPTTVYWAPAPTYTYTYDAMGRPISMGDNTYGYSGSGVPWVQNGTYDIAGRMTSMMVFSAPNVLMNPALSGAETVQNASYNVNGQLTSMNWQYPAPYTSYFNKTLSYAYSTTNNNGQITGMTEFSGETISYGYDSLKRLTGATAVTGGSTTWTQSFGYDGFGNMTSKTLNGGMNSAPAIDPTTNRLTSGYDANGNMLTGFGLTMTYDEENRVASASPTTGGTEYYGYAPDNKRIYRWNPTTSVEEWTFYGAKGERIGTFVENTSGFQYGFVATATNVWFGGKLIAKIGVGGGYMTSVVRDRTGSDRETGAQFYPYGDEITSTANDTEKFGTYVRDSFTDLDYADQRYYASSYGRFNTADSGAVHLKNPGGWNRYAYVGGDPINRIDPRGLDELSVAGSDSGADNQGPIFSTTVYGISDPGYSNCVWNPASCGPFGNLSATTGNAGGGNNPGAKIIANRLSNAFSTAELLLKANPDCAGIFGTGVGPNGAVVSAADVLSSIQNNGYYGEISINDIASPTGAITSASTVGANICATGGACHDGASITINDLAGVFVNGTAQDQLTALLHELGHAMNEIFGPGTSVIQTDGSDPAGIQASMQNTSAIETACTGSLAGSGLPVILAGGP